MDTAILLEDLEAAHTALNARVEAAEAEGNVARAARLDYEMMGFEKAMAIVKGHLG